MINMLAARRGRRGDRRRRAGDRAAVVLGTHRRGPDLRPARRPVRQGAADAVAFFTRTQTGALTSRLNNDVIGAQNAVTSTLGSVVSNVVVLVTTLAAMLALEWRLTLLALVVLPLFIIPAKRVGKRLQAHRPPADEHQRRDEHADDRAVQRRRRPAGEAVRPLRTTRSTLFAERAAKVRDIGIRSAMYGRVFFVALGLVGALGAAAIYGVGAHLVVSGDIPTGTLVALAALVTRVYQPLTGLTNARVDLMTAMVSFERVFEVLDAPETITDRPGAVDLVEPKGRVEFDDVTFRYPPAAEVTVAVARGAQRRRSASDPDRDVLAGVSPDAAARRDGGARRCLGRGQDHAGAV